MGGNFEKKDEGGVAAVLAADEGDGGEPEWDPDTQFPFAQDVLLKTLVNTLAELPRVYDIDSVRKIGVFAESGTAINTYGDQLDMRLAAQAFVRGDYGQMHLVKRYSLIEP